MDNDASTDRHADDIHSWYAALAADHPGYTFEHYDVGLRHKWAATALHLDCHPWCVVTATPTTSVDICHLAKASCSVSA
jgi:hypothetical protein